MKYTAGQAAKAAGVATSTITKALKAGKISGERDEHGAFQIDPAELHRVYPPKASKALPQAFIERDATPEKEAENRGLERLVESLQEQLRNLRNERDETVADLRTDRDGWRQQAERLALMLPPPANAPASESDAPAPIMPTPAQGKRGGGLWAWLRGKTPSND